MRLLTRRRDLRDDDDVRDDEVRDDDVRDSHVRDADVRGTHTRDDDVRDRAMDESYPRQEVVQYRCWRRSK